MSKRVREVDPEVQAIMQAGAQEVPWVSEEFAGIKLGDKRLEKDLPDMHQRVSDNLDTIAGILEDFAQKTDQYNNQNNIAGLREQEALGK